MYKGASIYSTICKHLKRNSNYVQLIDKIADYPKIVIDGCGYGELALLISLVCPNSEVYACDEDIAKLDIAKSSADGLVNNLKFVDVLFPIDCKNSYLIRLSKSGEIL